MIHRAAQAVLVTLLFAGITVSAQSKAPLTISPANPSVEKGKTVQLSAYQNGSKVTAQWSSSAPSVASVSGSGLVTALAGGKTTISAKRGPSRASTTVTVTVPSTTTTTTTPPPTSTTVDPTWVHVFAGESIQSKVNAYPNGTTFYLRTGVHRRQQVTPKYGNSFVGEQGAIMDGENVTSYAFYANQSSQSNVTIRLLEIRNYTTPYANFGAISGENVSNWTVMDNAVHHNRQAGIRAGAGTGWRLLRNKVYANGVVGISGYRCNGALIQDNESYGNNPSRTNVFREGGMKLFQAANLVIRGNYVHHNYGKGIWSDTNYPTTLIENNRVMDNSGTGIYHEISYAAIIRNNISVRNGHGSEQVSGGITRAGIQVTNSPNVQVYGNTVTDNYNGISGGYYTGYPTSGPYGAYTLQNFDVHDNTVRMSVGRTGVLQNVGTSSVYTSWNNRFYRNTYHLGASSIYFTWSQQNINELQWKSYGHDQSGTFIR